MTATLLLESYQVETILFTGVAGAVHPSLDIGDIVVCSGAYQHDMDARPIYDRFQIPLSDTVVFEPREEDIERATNATNRFLTNIGSRLSTHILSKFSIFEPSVSSGLVATGDQFVSSKEKHEDISLSFNGKETYAVEMEGAAVSHICNEFSVPCIIIRTISDKADHSAQVNFHEFIEEVASYYSQNIVREFLLEV
jgi:adenosylhomocysteine nucleosidase